jgi:hypothetical protein
MNPSTLMLSIEFSALQIKSVAEFAKVNGKVNQILILAPYFTKIHFNFASPLRLDLIYDFFLWGFLPFIHCPNIVTRTMQIMKVAVM